jgi:hypothetical protein
MLLGWLIWDSLVIPTPDLIIDQNEFCQTTRAMGQEKNKCNKESIRKEQREQDVSFGEEWMK